MEDFLENWYSNKPHDWKEGRIKEYRAYKKSFDGNGREIIVASKNMKNVDFLSFMWFDYSARINIQRFFFENDILKKWGFFYETGDLGQDLDSRTDLYKELPEDIPPMPEEYLKSFQDLSQRIPNLSESLMRCVDILNPKD